MSGLGLLVIPIHAFVVAREVGAILVIFLVLTDILVCLRNILAVVEFRLPLGEHALVEVQTDRILGLELRVEDTGKIRNKKRQGQTTTVRIHNQAEKTYHFM